MEACKWYGGMDICDISSCNEVHSKKHALSYGDCSELRNLRVKYKGLLWGCASTAPLRIWTV
eukprot:scaffold262043_cov22-Tisochrysis_lutea.AAC.1